MKIGNDELVLSTGKRIYCFANVIGLNVSAAGRRDMPKLNRNAP